jgi:hypothetical protein
MSKTPERLPIMLSRSGDEYAKPVSGDGWEVTSKPPQIMFDGHVVPLQDAKKLFNWLHSALTYVRRNS